MRETLFLESRIVPTDPDSEFSMPFVRQFGLTDIDDGPYCCRVSSCLRITGFRTQDALDTHMRRFH